MKRISVLVATPVLAASLLATAPAHAAGKVSDKDFLSAAKVGAAVPALAGATMATEKLKSVPVTTSCTAAGKNLKPKSARVAAYTSATGTVAATGIVAEMKSVKDAKKVIAARAKEIKCGTFTVEGITVTYTKGSSAKLGDQRVAQHMTIDGTPAVTDLVTIRKGTRIVTIALTSGDGTAADITPLVKKAYKAGL